MSFRSVVKKIPGAAEIYGAIRKRDRQNLAALAAFAPNSAGTIGQRLELAFSDAERAFPFLVELLRSAGLQLLEPQPAEEFARSDVERQGSELLAELFNRYGSDKSSNHNYHHVYGAIFERGGAFTHILEVGLGTNNEEVVSNMGPRGRPGASLRAFRDYLPAAQIYGADIDRRVLFTEDRIATFFVDQLDPASFDGLKHAILGELDLVIDDGLHSPAANIAVLDFAVRKLRPGGWVVIEDIAEAAVPVWQVIAQLLNAWSRALIDARGGYLFVAQRPH
jgi:hypothetical protein